MRFKNNLFLFSLLMLFALLASGCSLDKVFTAKSAKNTEVADRFARSFLETLKTGDMEEVSRLTTPEVSAPAAREKLRATIEDMNNGEIIFIETIKSQVVKSYFSKKTRTMLAYQVELEDGWLKAVVVMDSMEEEPDLKISALYIEPLKRPMAELYAFNISGAPTTNYIVLIIAAFIPGFIIYTISVCLKMRKHIKHSVMWIFFIIVGFGTFSYDWTSGQAGFKLFSTLLMGGGAFKDTIYGPWIISFSFPLGAVVFLVYLRRRLEKEKAAKATEKPASSNALEE